MQRAALDFLWGGGWQEVILERGVVSNVTAVNASAGGAAGMTIKAIALPPVGSLNAPNRALNARFAGVCPASHSMLDIVSSAAPVLIARVGQTVSRDCLAACLTSCRSSDLA